MKRPVITAVLLFAVAGLAGCPIYDHDNDGCYSNSDCGQSYVCDTQSGACVLPVANSCVRPSDCDSTYTCTPAGMCTPGDCTLDGCVGGYHCDSGSGVWTCVLDGSTGAAGAAGAAGQSGAGDQAGQGGALVQGGQSASEGGAAGVATGGVAGN